jgi:hypothetical protein
VSAACGGTQSGSGLFEDYLLSNDYVDTTQQVDVMTKELKASRGAVRAVVNRAYLEAALSGH